MNFESKATMVIASWIRHNGLQKSFGLARDVQEFKRLVSRKLFGDRKPDESFIKGAKLANWDALYRVIKV